MAFNLQGVTTGILGYSLKKELFGDAILYREVETFSLECYSSDLLNLSPAYIQSGLVQEFSNKYSGDINCKVFNVPSEFQFPSDSIRTAKFTAQVEIKHTPNLSGFNELGTGYYLGLDSGFFIQYSPLIVDFREDFNFNKGDNGTSSFDHTLSFGLLSGGKPLAIQIVSGIFGTDYNIPLGAVAVVSSLSGANPNLVQNYYTETYDEIRNTFAFSKKREFLPADYNGLNYNLNHILSLQEDGIIDVSEKCDLKAKISFLQAQQGLGLLFNGAYTRCSDYYNIFQGYSINTGTNNISLFNTPKKYVTTFNNPTLEASYDVTYTNDPEVTSNGVISKELIELDVNNKNIVNISDKYTFNFNKRTVGVLSASSLISGGFNTSPNKMATYYGGCDFYTAAWPLHMIKYDMAWPNNKSQASVDLVYSNNPRNNVTINGVYFNVLDYTIDNNVPEDLITEYKIVNRPNKLSVINYAYQSSVGEIAIKFTSNIGRQCNEFLTGFRTDLSAYLYALYQYGITLFMQQFTNIIPINFSYYLVDVKYNIDSNGVLAMQISFRYTVKKYIG
jgi:hypothetical protein